MAEKMTRAWVIALTLVAGGAVIAQDREIDREAFRELLNSNWIREQELGSRAGQGSWSRSVVGRFDEEHPYFPLALRLDQNYRRWAYSQVTPLGGPEARASQALQRRMFYDSLREERQGHSRSHPWPGRHRWY